MYACVCMCVCVWVLVCMCVYVCVWTCVTAAVCTLPRRVLDLLHLELQVVVSRPQVSWELKSSPLQESVPFFHYISCSSLPFFLLSLLSSTLPSFLKSFCSIFYCLVSPLLFPPHSKLKRFCSSCHSETEAKNCGYRIFGRLKVNIFYHLKNVDDFTLDWHERRKFTFSHHRAQSWEAKPWMTCF